MACGFEGVWSLNTHMNSKIWILAGALEVDVAVPDQTSPLGGLLWHHYMLRPSLASLRWAVQAPGQGESEHRWPSWLPSHTTWHAWPVLHGTCKMLPKIWVSPCFTQWFQSRSESGEDLVELINAGSAHENRRSTQELCKDQPRGPNILKSCRFFPNSLTNSFTFFQDMILLARSRITLRFLKIKKNGGKKQKKNYKKKGTTSEKLRQKNAIEKKNNLF